MKRLLSGASLRIRCRPERVRETAMVGPERFQSAPRGAFCKFWKIPLFVKNPTFFQKIKSKFMTFRAGKHSFFMKLFFQSPLQNFLQVVGSHPRYLEGPPTSELYNAPTLVAVRPQNPFFIGKKLSYLAFSPKSWSKVPSLRVQKGLFFMKF